MTIPALWLPQAASFTDEAWFRFVEMLGAGIFFAVCTVALFRGKLTSVADRVDINTAALTAHKKEQAEGLAAQRREVEESLNAAEERLAGKIAELHQLIVRRENTEVVETLRAEGRLANEFTALRKENSERHADNRRDRRVDRRQQVALLEIIVDTLPARGRKQVDAAMKMLRIDIDADSDVAAA